MQRSLSAPLTFYPAYCFSLSPTYNEWAKLYASDVHELRERPGFEGQNLYFYLNHPIKWIRLVGIVVALDVYSTRCIMILDDSSGATIEITCGRPKAAAEKSEPINPSKSRLPIVQEISTEGVTATGRTVDLKGVDIGTVVKVKGSIGTFRENRQLLLERISILHTTNAELVSWSENTYFRRDILDKSWVVTKQEEQRARRKAEGLDRKERARAERRRRRVLEEKAVQIPARKQAIPSTDVQKSRRCDEVTQSAAESATLQQAEVKRLQEKQLRQQKFEKLKKQKREAESDERRASKELEARIKEQHQATLEEQERRRKADIRAATGKELSDRVQAKRDQEKRLRELEFERLKSIKEFDQRRKVAVS